MVNYPTILNLPQKDINRQLYERVLKLQVKAKYHVLSLTINDGTDPISGATVTIGSDSVTTGADGKCKFELVDGTYDISVTKTGYADGSSSVTISGKKVSKTISLTATGDTGTVTVTGVIDEGEIIPIVLQTAMLYTGNEIPTQQDDSNLVALGVEVRDIPGNVLTLYMWDTTTHQQTENANIPFGTYNIHCVGDDTYTYTGSVTVDGNETLTITLTEQ